MFIPVVAPWSPRGRPVVVPWSPRGRPIVAPWSLRGCENFFYDIDPSIEVDDAEIQSAEIQNTELIFSNNISLPLAAWV